MFSSCFQEAGDEEQLMQSDSLHQGLPRMRALQDFGLKILPSKRKDSPLVKPKMNHDGYHRARALPDADISSANANYDDGKILLMR